MNKTILLLLLSVLTISACTTTSQEEPTIATTFAPLHDLTSTIAHNVADVYSIVPAGVDPHVFEPGPQDIRRLADARAFVTLGIEFEAFEEQLKNSVREDTLIVPAAQGIPLLDGEEHHDEHAEHAHEENSEGHEHSDDEHAHEEHHVEVEFHEDENKIEYHVDLFLPTPCHSIQEDIMYEGDELIIALSVQQPQGEAMCAQVITEVEYESEVVLEQYVHEVIILFEGETIFEEHLDELHHKKGDGHHHEVDPHVWLSPNNAILMVHNIRAGLIQAFPQDEQTITANAQALIEELELLAQEYAQGLYSCKKDTIIVAHNAYSYLAQDYNFSTIAISGLSHESEPSPQQLRRLIDEAREHNVSIIFFEELASPRVAETIAQAVGAETRMLNPLESGRTNYLDGMRENLYNLQEALECQ